jgi:hypothetical protein
VAANQVGGGVFHFKTPNFSHSDLSLAAAVFILAT